MRYVYLIINTYDMKTKLTLTVDEGIVEKAKAYAEKNSESLSSSVEKFLKNRTLKNKKYSVVDASKGLLKGKYPSMSSKQIIARHYQEKHGL